MAQDYSANYTSSPNAEIYALLAQQNEQAANRAARFADGGSYSGAGANVSVNDILGMLSRAQDQSTRAKAMDALSQRVAAREQMGLQQQQGAWQLDMQRAAMEEVARKKMELNLQEVQLNAQLATARGDARQPLLDELERLEQSKLDLNSRELSANSLLVQRNTEAARDFATRLKELRDMQGAMTQWNKGIDEASKLEDFLAEYMKNPAKGGMGPQSALGGALGGSDMGMGKLKEGVFRFGEWISELFSGNTVADMELMSYLRNSPAAANMVAAAGQNKTFLAALKAGGGSSIGLEQASDLASANRASAQMLSDLFTRALVNSGTQVDVPAATLASEKLIGEMIDLSNSANLKPEEMATRMNNALKQASTSIFGNIEGEKGLPKLAEALDAVLKKAGMLSGKLSAGAVGAGGRVGMQELQNAAAGYIFGQASSLRNVLRTGVAGKIMTADQLASALGYMEGVYDPRTQQMDVGLLPLEATTEGGRALRAALGDKRAKTLDELMELTRTTRTGTAASSREALELEAKIRKLLMKLQEGGPGDVTGLRSQAELLAKKLEELRAAPPVKRPPMPVL